MFSLNLFQDLVRRDVRTTLHALIKNKKGRVYVCGKVCSIPCGPLIVTLANMSLQNHTLNPYPCTDDKHLESMSNISIFIFSVIKEINSGIHCREYFSNIDLLEC